MMEQRSRAGDGDGKGEKYSVRNEGSVGGRKKVR